MSLLQEFYKNNNTANGMYISLVCNDESIYEGSIVVEAAHGAWVSVGGNEDRLLFFPWTSVNRVVVKKS
jgi:hypothetical protein